VGWRNQAFLTAALRADANSAFGESFNAAYYPKLSGSWVISDADFWNVGFMESLRFRVAWGQSGMQPDAFAATRTYSPSVGPGDVPTVRTGAVGNPDLKPEVGTELEAGFDASLFQGRLTLEATAFQKVTKDAMLQSASAPSGGFASNMFVNAGEVSNKGFEFTMTANPIASEGLDLSVSGTVSHTRNKLTDDGGLPALQIDRRGRFQMVEGYPLGGSWSRHVATADWGGPDGRKLVNVTCYGGPPGARNLPKEDLGKYPGGASCDSAPYYYVGNPGPGWTGSVSPQLRIGSDLTLNAQFAFVADAQRFNTTRWKRDNQFGVSYLAMQQQLGVLDPIRAASIQEAGVEIEHFEYEDHIRMRDLTLGYNLPNGLVERIGASRALLTVSGRNLWTPYVHSSFQDLDPGTRESRDIEYGFQFNVAPAAHSLVTTLRVTF
jgi:outer membrane receptor protein involved in Fe transport